MPEPGFPGLLPRRRESPFKREQGRLGREERAQAGRTVSTTAAPSMFSGGLASAGTGGGGGGTTGGFTLPNTPGALTALRGLQMQATSGLAELLGRDPDAMRKAFEGSLYESQAEAINRQADLSRRGLLEGTFARGIGQSSIASDLQGRLEQQRLDALARASREAFNLAGQEARADLMARQGLLGLGFNLGTTGLQAEANVGLANLAREQAAQQFSQNLAYQQAQAEANRALAAQQFMDQLAQRQAEFTGGQTFTAQQNELNRALQAQQFAQNLALQQSQLAQQAQQFGQNLAFRQSQLSAQEQAALNAMLAGAIPVGITGLGQFFEPTIRAAQGPVNEWLQQAASDAWNRFVATGGQG